MSLNNLDRVTQSLTDLNSTLGEIKTLVGELVKDKKSYIAESDLWDEKEANVNILERDAAIQHDIWSHWMKYFFSCVEKYVDLPNKCVGTSINDEKVARWMKQMNTKYADLTEEEKESDRNIVRRFIYGETE